MAFLAPLLALICQIIIFYKFYIFFSKGSHAEAIDETSLKMLLETILETISNQPLYQ